MEGFSAGKPPFSLRSDSFGNRCGQGRGDRLRCVPSLVCQRQAESLTFNRTGKFGGRGACHVLRAGHRANLFVKCAGLWQLGFGHTGGPRHEQRIVCSAADPRIGGQPHS